MHTASRNKLCLVLIVAWSTVGLVTHTLFSTNLAPVGSGGKRLSSDRLNSSQKTKQIETAVDIPTAVSSHLNSTRTVELKGRGFHDGYMDACKARQRLYPHQQGWEKIHRALEGYAMFHNRQVERLKACMYKQDVSSCRSIKTLTWSCADFRECSGVGDQLYQIQFALVLAVIYNRVLFVSWNSESMKTMKHLQPNKINWKPFGKMDAYNSKEVLAQLDTPEFAEVLSSSYAHLIISSPGLPVPFFRAFSKARKVAKFDVALHNFGLAEILRTEKDRDKLSFILGELLNYLFNFSTDVLSGADALQTSLGLKSSYVAVHIRTGFIGSEYEETGRFNYFKIQKNQSLWNQTVVCSLKLADRELGLQSPLYLATDSQLVKTWARQRFGGRIRVSDFTPYHVALEHNTSMDDYESTGLWVDFLTMARATYLVHGISSFSNNAGCLCSIPKHRQCTILECKC